MTEPIRLGCLHVCLDVKDVARSVAFYETLGFERTGGEMSEGWAILCHEGATLGLYQGHIGGNLLNFRGGDVFALHRELTRRGLAFETDAHVEGDGSDGAVLRDPDGNEIYLNTAPGETPDD